MTLEQLRQSASAAQKKCHIRCCTVGGCLSANGAAVKEQLETAVAASDLTDQVQVSRVGCMGLCSQGPLVRVASDAADVLYRQVTPEQSAAIVASLNQLSHPESSHLKTQPMDSPFFTRQHRIVLENSGRIDPEKIEEYIAASGYEGLHHCLREMSPEAVVDEITRSGLRGRGGAGYPTGLKWATVAKMPPGQKYVVCNADEGDPGAYMDRSVLESDPHRVLEGLAIAAYAVGANQGYIYVRGEYPLAINHLQTAIRQAKRHGLLGSQIFDSPFDFRVDLRIGAGAFVCGEETALMASIEGKRGIPRPRPPYPAESGLWGCPTLINNVETYANIAPIIRNGADWFASIG
ncbi:NAD(P)H-dependent oxidoreductase subunit E, partial [Leptolyngbya cf. ectocarpi LEGE 11479]